MATPTNIGLGNLARLPREIRLQILELCLEDDDCFRVLQSESLYETHHHDPWLPCGILRTSKALASDAAAVLPNGKVLRVIVDSRGWKSNYSPSSFRNDWEAPELGRFVKLELAVMAVAEDSSEDEAEFWRLRSILMKMIGVLRHSEVVIPIQVTLRDHGKGKWKYLYCIWLDPPPAPAASSRVISTVAVLWPLRSTNDIEVRISKDDEEGPFVGVQTSCNDAGWAISAYKQLDAMIKGENGYLEETMKEQRRVRQAQDSVKFDNELDKMVGPAASQLREDRRTHWNEYTKATRSELKILQGKSSIPGDERRVRSWLIIVITRWNALMRVGLAVMTVLTAAVKIIKPNGRA